MNQLKSIQRFIKIIINGKCENCNMPFEEIPNANESECPKCKKRIPSI